jgi:L-2-hydroxyglutarate oxidase LhgO
MDRVDCVVVGAGVVGLAIARALALAGREVIILEALTLIGSGVSSRNSEVIHAGIYYPQGSLKARLCVRGRELLYDYCSARGVAHQRCGKLVVATSAADEHKLDTIRAHAAANGVVLTPLTRAQAQALEPELACAAALHSPLSGIIDSHGLMTALLGDAEAAGALLALQSPLEHAQRIGDGWLLRSGGAEPFEMHANWLINSAGLEAQAVAARLAGVEADIRRYWPRLPANVLTPDYSGIRPKLSGPGEAAADFHIAGPAQHGCPGVVQLFGIESPGLTAALAMGEHVAALMDNSLSPSTP